MESILNEKYVLHSCRCECYIDTTHNEDGSTNNRLRIRALPEEELLFAYVPREGLVKIDPKTGRVVSKNVLGELLRIKTGDQESLINFIHDYGFLFPISSNSLESFSFEEVFLIIRRVEATLNLMSLLNDQRMQYQRMMNIICWLTLAPQLTFSSIDDVIETFSTCKHNYRKFMSAQEEGQFETFDYDPYSPTQRTIEDTIENKAVSFTPTELSPEDLIGNKGLLNSFIAYDIFSADVADSEIDKLTIDYFYHITKEIGTIVSLSDSDPRVVFNCGDDMISSRFSTNLKKATPNVAKGIIKEELDYAINSIYPVYDTDSMSGMWVIPDLYSALFFSIFFIRSDMELYKKCENPNCGRYVLVSSTNSRRKYCCTECSNAVQQRKHRQRKKASN